MASARPNRNSHERNLERDIEQRLVQPAARPAAGSRGGVPAADATDDVAARLAREAVIREAARRAHGRTD